MKCLCWWEEQENQSAKGHVHRFGKDFCIHVGFCQESRDIENATGYVIYDRNYTVHKCARAGEVMIWNRELEECHRKIHSPIALKCGFSDKSGHIRETEGPSTASYWSGIARGTSGNTYRNVASWVKYMVMSGKQLFVNRVRRATLIAEKNEDKLYPTEHLCI